MQVSRRKFFKICAGGMAGTSAAMLGLPIIACLWFGGIALIRAKAVIGGEKHLAFCGIYGNAVNRVKNISTTAPSGIA